MHFVCSFENILDVNFKDRCILLGEGPWEIVLLFLFIYQLLYNAVKLL